MFGFLKKFMAGQSDDLANAIAQGGSIIDVRTPAEFSGGSALNAINIPHTDIAQSAKKIAKLKQPIIVCCASGMRSGLALQELKRLGYDQVVNGKTWGHVQKVAQSMAKNAS